MAAAEYASAITAVRPQAQVRLIEGVDHVGITLEPAALAAVVEAVCGAAK